MKKKIFKYSVYFVIFITLFCIGINTTTRNIVLRLFQIHKLKGQIETATKTNLELKKRLENLQTKPFLMEKYTKQDLNLLADGEIEYHFNDYTNEDEVNEDEVKNEK